MQSNPISSFLFKTLNTEQLIQGNCLFIHLRKNYDDCSKSRVEVSNPLILLNDVVENQYYLSIGEQTVKFTKNCKENIVILNHSDLEIPLLCKRDCSPPLLLGPATNRHGIVRFLSTDPDITTSISGNCTKIAYSKNGHRPESFLLFNENEECKITTQKKNRKNNVKTIQVVLTENGFIMR